MRFEHSKDMLSYPRLLENRPDDYYEWLYEIIYDDGKTNGLTFHKLMHTLYHVNVEAFEPTASLDGSLINNTKHFYSRFAEEVGQKRSYSNQCGLLDMMIYLSIRMEEMFMSNQHEGDRTGVWFWNMIHNLGLGTMDDNNFDRDYCYYVIYDLLNRNYDYRGEHALFTLHTNHMPLNHMLIWEQASWYLSENYDNEFKVHTF